MAKIREILATELSRYAPGPAVRSVANSLSALAEKPVGALDVVELRALLTQLEVAVKTFSGNAPTSAVKAGLRQIVTGGSKPASHEEHIRVRSDSEVLHVQTRCLTLCRGFFSSSDCVRLATAASELARNIYMYAKEGDIRLKLSEESNFIRFDISAKDQGPGIPNLDVVLSGAYVSRTGMGKGLRGTKSLLDHCTITSKPGEGTSIEGYKKTRVQ